MNRRVVTFSTHGLVPGDLPGLSQPALALAATDRPEESPLLTLEDILGLKMNADWVVLSACNTKAVLVTHWAVETKSARQLVTEIFRRYGADKDVTRAQTLRLAQLVLIYSKRYAHPFYWAPFAIIGDGGR